MWVELMKNTKSTLDRRELLRHLLWAGSGSLLPGMLSEVQKSPIDTHLQDLKVSMKSNNSLMSEAMLREYLKPKKVITRRIQGEDYHFSFVNSAGHRITLRSEQGHKKTLIG